MSLSRSCSGLVLGIDASRNRSGGALAHLKGILEHLDPAQHGITKVHLWVARALADAIPDRPWLVKHSPSDLDKSLPRQLWWQYRCLKSELIAHGCDLLFSTGASTAVRFVPMVVLSQDLLPYDPKSMRLYRFHMEWFRPVAIRSMMNRAFRASQGVIFLTQHASEVIQRSCGALTRTVVVPHGVGEAFRATVPRRPWPERGERPISCVYVSNALLYKHPWSVVRGVAELRRRGHAVELTLVGGGVGRAQRLLERQIALSDPEGAFIRQLDFVPHGSLPTLLAQADLFVFASGCEAFGITLLEGMAMGLPVACSSRSSLPEILQDGGLYFNPEDSGAIADALERLIREPDLRASSAKRVQELAAAYSWSRCSFETFAFLARIAHDFKSISGPQGAAERKRT